MVVNVSIIFSTADCKNWYWLCQGSKEGRRETAETGDVGHLEKSVKGRIRECFVVSFLFIGLLCICLAWGSLEPIHLPYP